MSDTRADGWNHLMCLVIIVAGLSVAPLDKFDPKLNIQPEIESALVYFLAAVATLTHYHFGYGVVGSIECVIHFNQFTKQFCGLNLKFI